MCVRNVKTIFVILFYVIISRLSYAGDLNQSLKSAYAIPTGSDSLAARYEFQPGMFADGDPSTAWVTGFDMRNHWADIKWKNRTITLRSIEIDFASLSIVYNGKNLKTVRPDSFELIAKISGRWVVLHSKKARINWITPLVAKVIPVTSLKNTSEIKILFSNTDPAQLYAVREIKVIAPERVNSLVMRPKWTGKALWIWGDKSPSLPNFGIVKRYFRKIFEIEDAENIESAILLFSACDRGQVFVNGESVAKTRAIGPGMKPEVLRVAVSSKIFKNGKNLFAVVGEDLFEYGCRGVIYQLSLKYKDGSQQNIYSDLKGEASSCMEKGWNTTPESLSGWSEPTRIAGASYPFASMWNLRYTPPYFTGDAEISRISLNPAIPKPGEEYKLEIDIHVDKVLKQNYGVIAEYGYETPVRLNIINYSLGEKFLLPKKCLPAGFIGSKRVVFQGIWPDGTPSCLPVRITICNRNNQLKIIDGPIGIASMGINPGSLLIVLGKKSYTFKGNGFPSTKIDDLGRLSINGELTPPIFYTSSNDNLEHFGNWRKSGIHLFRILPQNTCPIIGTNGNEAILQERVLKTIETTVKAIVSDDENAKFLLMIGLNMPNEWKFNHPEELIVLGDRTRLISINPKNAMLGYFQESPNSEAVLKKMTESLKSFLAKLKKKAFSSKIMGLCLYQGRAGENYWGLNINQYKNSENKWVVADRKHYVFGDYGLAFRKHFGNWLKDKYKRKAKLNEAWKVKGMDFTDVVSSSKWPIRRFMSILGWRNRPEDRFTFRDRLKEGWIFYDYVRHQNEARAALFIKAAKAIKEASGGRLLVGGYIGYSVPSLTNSPPGSAQHTGHLAMRMVRDCPYFDFACSPHFYHFRRYGDPVMPHDTYDSLKLHGKMWMNEFDSRTFLSPFSPKTFSLKETRGVLKKEFAFAFTKDQGWWWLQFAFDFVGPRGAGWFSDPALLKDARIMRDQYKESMRLRRAKSKSEIAVFLNEEQGYYTDGYSPANTIHSNLINYVLPMLQKTGAPHDLFAQADLQIFTENDFYKSYKLIIFLNAFHLSTKERSIINEKLKKDGRTLLFFYAPGYQGNFNGNETELSLKGIEDVIGMKGIRKLDESHVLGMKMNATKGSLEDDLFNAPGWGGSGQIKRYGQELGPVFYLRSDNHNWKSLAVLRIDNKINMDKTALAMLSAKDYSVWYSSIPYLPLKELRRIVKASGAHVYSDADILVYANKNYIAVHSGKAIDKLKVYAKSAKDWREIFENRNYGKNRKIIEFDLMKGETKVFRISDPQE